MDTLNRLADEELAIAKRENRKSRARKIKEVRRMALGMDRAQVEDIGMEGQWGLSFIGNDSINDSKLIDLKHSLPSSTGISFNDDEDDDDEPDFHISDDEDSNIDEDNDEEILDSDDERYGILEDDLSAQYVFFFI